MDDNDIPDDLPAAGERPTFEIESGGRPPSVAIVEAIASIEGVQPSDVDFTLYESVDPDVLDTLFQGQADEEGEEGLVAEFHVASYNVQIAPAGTITVEAPEEPE